MDINLEGRVAVVTGASRGIGAAIAAAYVQAGAQVVITARKPDGLAKAAAEIGSGVHAIAAHAGKEEDAARVVDETLEKFGRLDILVNNAATNPYMGPLIDASLPAWDKTFEVNLRGPLIWTQAAYRGWMKEHGGSIINISSIDGLSAGGPLAVYGVTKSALIFLTQQLATEVGPGVRVNVLAPGLVKTDFARALWEGAGEDAKYPWPLQRLGKPEDIANAALFLASDASSWVTGGLFVIDGGGSLGGAFS
ncbi:SDR family oxidoreductase [Cryptosporangium phraense]|uniref:SDR family oxidoreductase n=1 Tax=Cryptosporangium phraense TaxID=2593070 RepID=A0A545AGZ9_9ACTN|nr:SDR family oxidoreductase [Cryptosporangium phraense]TQS40597.1 SDR family oxidoreductase [Cryptosporangium phraense]